MSQVALGSAMQLVSRTEACPSVSRSDAVLRLFCFPYGGGGASIYRDWRAHVPNGVELCPVQLPGREERIRDLRYTNVRELVADLGPCLLPALDRPFALFGYSMGALVSFELARFLRAAYKLNPAMLFTAAYPAPHLVDPEPRWCHLPDEQFMEKLRALNGTRQEVLEDRELLALMMPLLRADVELVQTYEYSHDAPFSFPITAFAGENDRDAPIEAVASWRNQTTAGFVLHTIPGDHFFLHSAKPLLLRQLSGALSQLVSTTSVNR